MASKNITELEETLKRLKEKEAALKEELEAKRKAADVKYQKELLRKKAIFAELFTEQFGIEVLDNLDPISFFISEHISEISNICQNYGLQE